MTLEYKVVYAPSIEILTQKVQSLLNDNWVLVGGAQVSVNGIDLDSKKFFIQTLTKEVT